MQYSLFYRLPQRVLFRETWNISFRLAVRLQMDFCSKCAKIGGRWKMFLFPFLEKSKKLLKWTGEHLTTPVNLDEHGATRNTKKAWRIATFLYIGEHRWQMFNGSPKRKVGDSNSFWRAINNAESLYFQRFSAFSFFCCGWRFAGKQARKCFCVKRGCDVESPLRASFRALPFRLWGSRSHLQYLNIPPYYASVFFRFDLSLFSV